LGEGKAEGDIFDNDFNEGDDLGRWENFDEINGICGRHFR
jgi:hypothetical protein